MQNVDSRGILYVPCIQYVIMLGLGLFHEE